MEREREYAEDWRARLFEGGDVAGGPRYRPDPPQSDSLEVDSKPPPLDHFVLVTPYNSRHVTSNDFTISTVDPNSFALEVYMRLCEVPFSTKGHAKESVILMDPTNQMEFAQGFSDILEALKYKGFTLPAEKFLDSNQKTDSYCYLELVQSHLYKIQLFNWWAEKKNAGFSKDITFGTWSAPFLSTKQELMIEKLKVEGYSAPYKKKIYLESNRIYKSLSEKLGSKDYFFGDEPSVLDCVVYGYLTIQFCADAVKDTLKNQIAQYENLKLFCKRMTFRVFNVETEEFDYVIQKAEPKEKTKEQTHTKFLSRFSSSKTLSSITFAGAAFFLVGMYQFAFKYYQAAIYRKFLQTAQQPRPLK